MNIINIYRPRNIMNYQLNQRNAIDENKNTELTNEKDSFYGNQTTQVYKNYSSWTSQENKIYITYLKDHLDQFQSQVERKKHKIFLSISKVVKTRTTDQVKSHHQKMMKRHKNSIPAIILFIEKKLQKSQKQISPRKRRNKKRCYGINQTTIQPTISFNNELLIQKLQFCEESIGIQDNFIRLDGIEEQYQTCGWLDEPTFTNCR